MEPGALRHRHILWDWNGTLLDDAWLCVDVVNGILGPLGLPAVTLESYREHFDFPVVRYYERIGLPTDPEQFDAISHRFIAGYHERFGECSLRAGAEDVLRTLHGRGTAMSVLSASRQDLLELAVGRFGIAQYFASLNGIDTIHATGKLERGRDLVDALGTVPAECVLVGDTVHDFEVAQALGLDCVLLADGHHGRARLEATGAPVIDSLAALARALRAA